GNARAVAVRLSAGKLSAIVAHRKPDETFAVITNDLRVTVRGTKFSVTAGDTASRVDVSEGQVAVQRADGSMLLVSAGGSFDSSAAPAAPSELPPAVASD